MFCRNCGAELQENASVCPKCGTAVNVPVASAATKSSQRNLPKKSTLIASVLVVILIALTPCLRVVSSAATFSVRRFF